MNFVAIAQLTVVAFLAYLVVISYVVLCYELERHVYPEIVLVGEFKARILVHRIAVDHIDGSLCSALALSHGILENAHCKLALGNGLPAVCCSVNAYDRDGSGIHAL